MGLRVYGCYRWYLDLNWAGFPIRLRNLLFQIGRVGFCIQEPFRDPGERHLYVIRKHVLASIYQLQKHKLKQNREFRDNLELASLKYS